MAIEIDPVMPGSSPLFPVTEPQEARTIVVCEWNPNTGAFEPSFISADLDKSLDYACNRLILGIAVILKTVPASRS